MKLDKKERLILANQFKILAALYPNERDSYERLEKVFTEGYELAYDWVTEWVYEDKEVVSEDECRRVLDILDMFSTLKASYEKLTDKEGIDPDHIRFWGFDGNHEGKDLGFARYLMEDEKKFTELANDPMDGLNSHMPTADLYDRMLSEWRAVGGGRKFPFTKEDIIRVAASRAHPIRR